jgi:hypothetical protein
MEKLLVKRSFSVSWIYVYYLFDQVGLFLAFFKPGFFLSLILGSLLSKPYGFNASLNSEFQSINALANHNFIASACHDIPHQVIFISASN